MILKVKQPLTDAWFYYDHVSLFKVRWGVRDEKDPIIEDQIDLLPEERDMGSYVASCVLNFDNGNVLEVVFAGEGYLLNDEGKTIERL